MDTHRIEELISECDQQVSHEMYLVASGQKGTPNTADVYATFAPVFTDENIRRIQGALHTPGTGKRERTRLSRILFSLISFYVEAAVAPLRDALESRKQTLIVSTPDGPVPYLRASEKTDAISDPRLRRAVWQAQGDTALTELAPTALRLWQERQRVARGLGYRSYAAMFAQLKGINLKRLAHDTELVLAATEAPHRAAMAAALRTHAGIPIQEATSADFRYVLRQISLRTQLGAVDAMAALRATVAGLGLDLNAVPGLVYDLEDRPAKRERAAIFPIDPPRHQIISCRPQAGSDLEYVRAMLHETGHGMHFAYTHPELSPIIRRFPDSVVAETMAYLLEGLVREPAWLEAVLGLHASRAMEVVAVQRLRARYMVRQMAGLCRYLLVLDHDTSEQAAVAFERILSEASSVRLHAGSYAIGPDPELYGVGYFYADMVTAQVAQSLRTAFGTRWWTSPACGRRLRRVWQHCSAGSPADLVRAFGHQFISPASLFRRLADEGVDGTASCVG